MSFKVAFIGAGSIEFTRKLVGDLLTVPEFDNLEIVFTDINQANLDMVTQLVRRDIESNNLPVTLTATSDRHEALTDAKYVFNVVRIGGIDSLKPDIEIPLKYGIDQCIGDTLCPGGIMYAQRGIPVLLEFCDDIREVSHPDCIMLNYANPMAMNTWACNKYGNVRTIGLCHGIQHGHAMIAEVIRLLVNDGRQEGDDGFTKVTADDVDIICAGINHQTWYIQVRYNGEEWTSRLLEGFEHHPEFSRTEKVRIDMLRRFGYFSTESNGHLSEYVPWYRKRRDEIAQWIDEDTWINGPTAGYLNESIKTRNWFETGFTELMNQPPMEYIPEKRTTEHGSYIVESLETGRVYRGHFNVLNNGTITNLPDDAIVEVPGYIDGNGISIPHVGELPHGCAAVCNASINVQRLAVEAAVHGDDMLLRQAMMMDPLTGAVCNPPEIWQMTDELLAAHEDVLPQYSEAIAAAKKRLNQ